MQPGEQPHIRYFTSFEARETALGKSVGRLLPCRHNGPRRFWQDFKKIAGGGLPIGFQENSVFIAADPRDSLAVGSPLQVLAAAGMCAGGQPEEGMSPMQAAAEMEIETLLHQSLRTLSGGESVKLALARSLVLAAVSSKLVVASPFSWLSRANRGLFDRVLDAYRHRRVPTEILALEGEDDLSPIRAADFWMERAEKPAFALMFSGARIAVGSPLNAVTDEQLRVRVTDFSGRLVSPCLLEGGNGQGKSLLARSLAGAVATRGKVAIVAGHAAGRARLLFQDVVTQTLLRSFNAILASAKAGQRDRILQLYARLCREVDDRTAAGGSSLAVRETEHRTRPRTLLEIKLLLIAVRLAERPPALILDEPDWGLSRSAAVALVAAVTGAAHAAGVPVILISHKPWWQTIAGSRLQVAKRPAAAEDGPFAIRLRQM